MINELLIYEFETVIANERGKVTDRSTKQAHYINFNLNNDVSVEMVEVPRQAFLWEDLKSKTREKGIFTV